MGQNVSQEIDLEHRSDDRTGHCKIIAAESEFNYKRNHVDKIAETSMKRRNFSQCFNSRHVMRAFSPFDPTILDEDSQTSSQYNEEVQIICETSSESNEEIIIEDVSNLNPPVTACDGTHRSGASQQAEDGTSRTKSEKPKQCKEKPVLLNSLQSNGSENVFSCLRSSSKTFTLKQPQKSRRLLPREKSENSRETTSKPKRKSFWCRTCKKFFANFPSFQRHRQEHLPPKPIRCQHCDKTFIRPYLLKRHVTIHRDDKPYVCTVCKKPYRLLHSLRRHARLCVQ